MKLPDPPRDIPYWPARTLLCTAVDALLPPTRLSVADFSEAHRWVKSPIGVHLQRWSHETAPYLTDIMEALSDEALSTVAVVGPAGCGKTMAAENWLLASIHGDPADFLWYGPSEPAVRSYVKDRIEPMLEAHEGLIGASREGVGRDSVDFKRFGAMKAQFLTFTDSTTRAKHVARIVADEVDAYDEALGDPATLLDYRRRAAGVGSMLALISHPDRAQGPNPALDWQQGIMAAYRGSDRRTWWWPCPDCGEFSSPNPGTAHHMAMHYPDDAPLEAVAAETRLLCPHCGAMHDEDARRRMIRQGRWLRQGQAIDGSGRITGESTRSGTAGFWIVGPMNPFLPDGMGSLTKALEKARRDAEVSGDDRALKQVMVKGWGIPYAPPRQVGAMDANALAERASPAYLLQRLPDFARVLTAAADTQNNRFEILVRAWGPGLESQVVDYEVIPAEPGSSPEDWDALLRRLATLSYPTGDGRHMRVRCATFDAVGQAGVTELAYAAWLRARRAGLARRLGQLRGRDLWTLLPARGASAPGAPRISVAYPEGARRDRRASARGEVPLLLFNPNQAKDALAAQLSREEGAGVIRFPAALRDEAGPPHPFFEQLAAESRGRGGKWHKTRDSARNEAWDLLVMTEVAARLHGVHRLNWAMPPGWAAPWPANTMMIGEAEAVAPCAVAPTPRPHPGPMEGAAAPATGGGAPVPPPVAPRLMPPAAHIQAPARPRSRGALLAAAFR